MPDSEAHIPLDLNVIVAEQKTLDRWEYKFIHVSQSELLNEFGSKGWQVITYLQYNNSFLLIRQLLEKEIGDKKD